MLDSVCISVSFLTPRPTMRDSAARISRSELHTEIQRVSFPGGGHEKAERTWIERNPE
jgi:hypothetical protein